MPKGSTLVALDVHKETIEVVVAEPGTEGEVRHQGRIAGHLRAVDRMVKQVQREVPPARLTAQIRVDLPPRPH